MGALLLFVAFVLHTFGRPEPLPSTITCVEVFVETLTCKLQRDPIAWYTADLLWDDICVGIAGGLIVGALKAKSKKKKVSAARAYIHKARLQGGLVGHSCQPDSPTRSVRPD